MRVLELSTVLAGPYCAMVLADLGADVIKVEPPEGDPTRGYGPPWIGPAQPGGERIAAYYLSVNRNKRSLRLDLHSAEGLEVLRRLIGRSDVLIENFRPGGLERLGLDDSALAALNAKLVHLSITGYGPDGPDAAKPGFDFVAQAVGGLMSVTGFARRGGRPANEGRRRDQRRGDRAARGRRRAGRAARGRGPAHRHLAARGDSRHAHQPGAERVCHRARSPRGAAMPTRTSSRTRRSPRPMARSPSPSRPSGSGRGCAWRWAQRLIDDPRFATNDVRVRNRDELRPLLAASFASRSSAEWLAALDAAQVPCGPVNDVLAAFAQPQAVAREMRVDVDHPVLGSMPQVGMPFKLSADPRVNPQCAAPARRALGRNPARAWLLGG